VRPFPLTVLNGGINRLRVKGGASASQLYDLQNGYITNAGSISPREGTIRAATLTSATVGLAANNGVFNIFSNTFTTSTAVVPAGYQLNVLVDPVNSTASPTIIWFAKPFMGFLYVVAQFSDSNIYHYWLQSNGTWTSNTVYKTGNIVTPIVQNGLAYQAVRDFPPNPTWSANAVVLAGAFVEPTQYTGFAYKSISVASDQGSQTGPSPSLLLHMDGSFSDSSPNNFPVTTTGSAVTETSVVKFGTGAGSFPAANSTAVQINAVTVPVAAGGPLDILSGAGDFTVEGFFYLNAGTTNFCCLVDYGDTVASIGNHGVAVQVNQSLGTFDAVSTIAGWSTVGAGAGATFNTGIWYHFALVRFSGTVTLYLNGIATGGTTASWVGYAIPAGSLVSIGGSAIASNNNVPNGMLMDEFRVTKGVALYTSNFTPATAPATVVTDAHTGSAEPVWPTVSAGVVQEFGDFSTSVTDAGTTQATTTTSSAALGKNLTDRYGNSSTIANAGTPASSSLTLPVAASTNVTTWAPGTLYAPGAVVQPTTNQGAFINAIPNGDFENGNDGNWTFTGTTPWAFSNSGAYQGNWDIQIPSGNMSAGGDFATMTNFGLVTPGQSVTASAYLNPNNAGANLELWIQLNWYDSTDTFLSATVGTHQEGGGYRQSSVTGTAPAKAAHCRVAIGAGSGTNSRNTGYADLVTWNLEQPAAISNFLYEAVQVAAASSGTAQPSWPTTQGSTVVDGGVTWKAIGTSIITWEAIPLMLSGAAQPSFPTTVGLSVNDPSTFTDANGIVINTHMSWQAVSRQITDPKCPNTNAVALGASHVFAGDKDIVDFSAAVDPTDWSSTNNAGYLPTGLNNYGDNPVAMLALYRSNLMAFNAGGYQMWQIDPDPANMALLDAQPVGSIWPRAAQSVANDLLFLTEVGVRNLGTVGATANMQVGSTGQPVDPLVKAQLQAGTYTPISLYYPGRGQYWLIFGPQAFVLTINGSGQKTWSRYKFPDTITDWTLNAGTLYLRTAGNLVWQLDANTIGVDDANTITTAATPTAFNGVVQWPYLDMGSLGLNKMMIGIDLVGEGSCSIQIAFDQSNKSTFNDNAGFATSTGVTAPYFVAIDDTVPGSSPMPFPINAPSYSLILTFTGSTTSANAWSWQAANLYVTDAKGGGATG
jgi:Concanavalin A-like lectin/glucanases superfamily